MEKSKKLRTAADVKVLPTPAVRRLPKRLAWPGRLEHTHTLIS